MLLELLISVSDDLFQRNIGKRRCKGHNALIGDLPLPRLGGLGRRCAHHLINALARYVFHGDGTLLALAQDVLHQGIPIQVVHDPNVMETDKVYVFNKPEEEYNPINGTKWWVRKPYGNTIVDDLVDDFRDFQIKRHDAFDTFYYGKWAYDNMVTKEKPEEDIDESAFMSILNGGGFNAVV